MPRPSFTQQVTFIYTTNLSASAYFYEEVLGLPLVLDQGACRIYRVGAGDAFLGICERKEATHHAPDEDTVSAVILTLVSDQVDDWYRYLKGQRVHFEKAPTHNPTYNIYHCFLRDPNGYLIEIQSFLDPNWPHPQTSSLAPPQPTDDEPNGEPDSKPNGKPNSGND